MNKKSITIMSILVLILATMAGTVVSAQVNHNGDNNGFFNSIFNKKNGPSIDELIEIYEDIKQTKEELTQLMEAYGIELPELTNEEKKEIIKTIRELKRTGHTRQEIRDEIVDLLIDFGVDLPDLTTDQRSEIQLKIRSYLETDYGFVFIELTPEQKAYMKQILIQLKREGNTKEAIINKLVLLYESYGGFIPELTDDEKEDIHDWIVSMLENDYNIVLPDLTFKQREELKNKKEEIRSLQKELRNQLKQASWINRFRFYRYVKNDNND